MKYFIFIISFLLCVISASAAEFKSNDGSVFITASSIEFTASSVIIAKGSVHLEASDKKNDSHIISDSTDLKVKLETSGVKTSGFGSIKSAEFAGPLKMSYSTKENGVLVKSTASADNGSYVSSTKIMLLTGNVKITHDNPAILDSPIVATGDKATVNLSPQLGLDESRYRIESLPGLSKIQFTPKLETGGKN